MTEPGYLIHCRDHAAGWTKEEVDFSTAAETDSGVHPGCRWLFPQGGRGVKLMTHFCLVPWVKTSLIQGARRPGTIEQLTFWRRNFLLNFSTLCI